MIFTGALPHSEIAGLLGYVDVWAMPTLSENFDNGLVEAMSVGLPRITTAGVNIASAAERAGGLIITERTDASFASEIVNILRDPALATSLSANGQAFAR